MGSGPSPFTACRCLLGICLSTVVVLSSLRIASSASVGLTLSSEQSALDVKRVLIDHWIQAAAKYAATTENTKQCSADYGLGYIKRWRALQGCYCNSTRSAEASTPGNPPNTSSAVTCHAHPEADISVCAARNLFLRSSLDFLGTQDSGIRGLPSPKQGSILLACQPTETPQRFLRGRLQSNEGSRMWFVQAPKYISDMKSGASFYQQMNQACSPSRRIQHPVLMITRVDPENAFHNLEGVVSVFAALAVLQQHIPKQLFYQGLEVVIADDRVPGYFLDIWRRLSHPFPLRILRHEPYPDNTCFSTLLLAPYTAHTQSMLTYKAGTADEVFCESVVLQAASMWLRHLFHDLLPSATAVPGQNEYVGTNAGFGSRDATADSAGRSIPPVVNQYSKHSSMRHYGPAAALDLAHLQPTPTQSQPALQHLHVLWLSRSRFERQHHEKLTTWQRTRQIPDEQQERLLLELQWTVLRWNQQTCVPGQTRNCTERSVYFTLQVAELSELPFYPDQVMLLMRTGVLVGVHGAGLANQVFMKPRRSAVIEVWFNMDNNYHYHNLAHLLGHKYYNVRSEEQFDVAAVAQRLVEAMDTVASVRAESARRSSWWRRAWGGG